MPKPEPRYTTPSLESITLRAKYRIPETDFNIVKKMVLEGMSIFEWGNYVDVGESLNIYNSATNEKIKWFDLLEGRRAGTPVYFSITTLEHYEDSILVEVECRSAMWFKIANLGETKFTENEVQESLLECKHFVKQVMSIFKGKEVEPVSVYPIIQRREIKSRLLNLGLKKIVNLLDEAEKHITQNSFTACLKSSRTAFEKMIDWEMKKRGLEQTNNYKNDLERLKSKGYLGSETTKLLQSYYRCLSSIAVHEKGEAETGIYEAQMGYGTTLIMLDYFANKLP